MWSTAQPSAALWNETESRAAGVGTAHENQCAHRTFTRSCAPPPLRGLLKAVEGYSSPQHEQTTHLAIDEMIAFFCKHLTKK